MCYFDARDMAITVKHVMASGALRPAFPAICRAAMPLLRPLPYHNSFARFLKPYDQFQRRAQRSGQSPTSGSP